MYAWLRLAVSGCNESVSSIEHGDDAADAVAATDAVAADDDADTHNNANGILMIK